MLNGYIKTACASVQVKVADTGFNTLKIMELIDRADADGVNILVLPELCVTGYTCGDLFQSSNLLENAKQSALKICEYTKDKYPVVVFGVPLVYNTKLYNCAVCVANGEILGVVPKSRLADWGEHCESRYFSCYNDSLGMLKMGDDDVLFGNNIVFCHEKLKDYTFGIELCEDLFSPQPVAEGLALSGANIILNLSASSEAVKKDEFRRQEVMGASCKYMLGYVYANADPSESTGDVVFSAHHIIAECGRIIKENEPFGNSTYITGEIDAQKISLERMKDTVFKPCDSLATYVEFEQEIKETELTFDIKKTPFVPEDNKKLENRAELILKMQSYGLKKRIEHTNAKSIVLGISGGLDSTLALLASVRAMDLCDRPRSDIKCITMPCFGTTKRTKSNAQKLCEFLGVSFEEIDITKSVTQHFLDIGHDILNCDVTYENSQARERTQVLMDLSNKYNGFVVGTGDMSELALGWATYNGDHMSMYGVNSGIPKTLVKALVMYEAQRADKDLKEVLLDILDTPVSPELLPHDKEDNIAQKTEEIVGPYELHDFYLYYTVRFGFSPVKIFKLADKAFSGTYNRETIIKWLEVFQRRFFAQQFKRSCMPDGVKVGSVSLSPRGTFKMPSDASNKLWQEQIDYLKKTYLV